MEHVKLILEVAVQVRAFDTRVSLSLAKLSLRNPYPSRRCRVTWKSPVPVSVHKAKLCENPLPEITSWRGLY